MTRRYLTANDMHALLQRQGGVCASANCVSEGPFEADPMCLKVTRNGAVLDRCEWCGVENPTHADLLVCREAPCRLAAGSPVSTQK